MRKIDYYEILQVSPNASWEVIDAAYRRLAKIYHPDAGGDEEMMKMLNEAYGVLKDPLLRKQYDASRTSQTSNHQNDRRGDSGKPPSKEDTQSKAGAGSHSTRTGATGRQRFGTFMVVVIASVVIFTFAWCLKSGKPAGVEPGQTIPGESQVQKAAKVEPITLGINEADMLEYFPLDTVHSLTITTSTPVQTQTTSLQQFLGKQVLEDREVYVVAEAYVSDDKIGDFKYTLYSMNENKDIYWVGQARNNKVNWERQPRLILPARMEIGREYVLRAVEFEDVLSETTTAKAIGFAKVTVSGKEFEDCLEVEKKIRSRSKQSDGSYNIFEECSMVYYARGVGPVYSQFTTKYLTEKDGKQTTTSTQTAEQYFANTVTLGEASSHLTAPNFNKAAFTELYPDLGYCLSAPLFEGSLVVAVGLEPTNSYQGEVVFGNLHLIIVGWNGSRWVTLWRLAPLETQVLSARPQELLEILSTEKENTALVVAKMGNLGNHPHSHIVAFTVNRSGEAMLEFMRFGYVTLFKQRGGVIEASWEEQPVGYQVYQFALQQGRCSVQRVSPMEYRPEGVASAIEARFAVINDRGIRRAVPAERAVLKAKVGQTVVFIPSDVEAEAELTQHGLQIYTDAWNGPPLTVCEANHLRQAFYTFEQSGVVHFKLLTRDEEQEIVEKQLLGETPQPTFTVVVE